MRVHCASDCITWKDISNDIFVKIVQMDDDLFHVFREFPTPSGNALEFLTSLKFYPRFEAASCFMFVSKVNMVYKAKSDSTRLLLHDP